jgi:adenylate cyclase
MTDNMDPTGTSPDADTLAPRELRVVLVCDVVESVRWMEQDEDNAITRWQAFTQHVRTAIVPAHGGSVVKSTGDGMMIEFPTARAAVQAANAMHAKALVGNTDPNFQRHLQLRTGIHETQARRDAHDLYGHGVNLAARITTLAGPGEIIVSAPVRDHLTDSLDGDIEDMGECYLKHLSEPQRVYRVGIAGSDPILVPQSEYAEPALPTIAVIPFESRSHAPEHLAIGELIADGVITLLCHSNSLKVISRLSTAIFRGRDTRVGSIGDALGATHVLSGSYTLLGEKLIITYELCQVQNEKVLEVARLVGSVDDLLQEDCELARKVVEAVGTAIYLEETQKIEFQPLPTLNGYSLLMGGIKSIHQSTKGRFENTKKLLEHLIERYPQSSDTRAWLAKWYVLCAVRGIGFDKKSLAQEALSHTQRALDRNPNSSLALSMEGFVYLHLVQDLSVAQHRLEAAVTKNPHESMAWLFSSVAASFAGNTQRALDQCRHAGALSPVDPLKYFFHSLHASAALSAGQLQEAITFALKSLRLNRHHSPTLRVLLTAQVEANLLSDARSTLINLLEQQPQLTVASYLQAGDSRSPTRLQCARALRTVGLSES